MRSLHRKKRFVFTSFVMVVGALVALFAVVAPIVHALPVQPHFNHFLYTNPDGDALYADGPEGEGAALANQQYGDRAYPNTSVGYDQTTGAYNAFQSLGRHGDYGNKRSWQLVGPVTGNVPAEPTYTGRPTIASGRVTALATSVICTNAFCPVWLGAAGGGIWLTYNALAAKPQWFSISKGLGTNAIGSIFIDPNDRSGKTIYVGTGEQNGSSDSEAGVGLFKSTDYGLNWRPVSGSIPVAKDRSIASVAVEPGNSRHIFIGTAVARHGSSAVNGGRFTPPNAPQVGLYESTDGGQSFTLAFSKPSDTVNPASPNGSDFFRGGVSKLLYDSVERQNTLYFSIFDYGLFRRTASGSYEQVFASAGAGAVANSAGSRTEFALAPWKSGLRIYLGDTDGTNPANLYRVDNARVAASALTDGTANAGWLNLSNPTKGTPGFSSYNYCGGQCSYDMPVASPPGRPDNVWIGGQMQYDEIFTATPPSNGRAVQRSTNAGASFTDMTNDNQTPPLGMHPDQHAIAFAPGHPDIAFLGSDGGLVRTGGEFVDTSSDCDKRGISGADLTDCKLWLSAIPTRIFSMNDGLATLQFQSVTVNPKAPRTDIIGGTQDNGTWAYEGEKNNWFESVGGDGGQSAIDYVNPNVRVHAYYGPSLDVNFDKNDPKGWNYISDPLVASKEGASFYIPYIADPKVGGTLFAGLEHVWRTQDSGGAEAYLKLHCNELTGDFKAPCGDWVPLGGPTLTGTSYGADKGGSYVVATTRATSDSNTLWTATRRGRLFISTNANGAAADVTFTRIDTAAQPTRFISGVAVDPKNANHAYVTFSGYNAYTPTTPGHVFDVTYDPAAGTATWKDISYDLGDQPITGVGYDNVTGNLYIATDFGVGELKAGKTHWVTAAANLPLVAVYSLTIVPDARVLYAATHGRGAWVLNLEK